MARSKTFTQAQVEEAKSALAQLPDLSKNKLVTSDVLLELKEQIIELSAKKGYTAQEIRSALEGVGISVSAKAITDVIEVRKRPKAARVTSGAK